MVCGQGPAPAAATVEAYTASASTWSPAAGCSPPPCRARSAAWMLLLREYGTLPLRDVLGYAIGYAEAGYPLVPAISWSIAQRGGALPPSTGTPRPRSTWRAAARPRRAPCSPTRRWRPPTSGCWPRRRRPAATARSRSRRPAAPGTTGSSPRRSAQFAATEVMDVTGERHRGLLTDDDLASWHARLEAPSTYDYAGLTVCKTGPWGQGPVFLQQLALLKGFDLAAMDPGSAEYIHMVTEVAKLAFADREALVRRPRVRRRPAGRAALGRLQRRAARADRRDRQRGPASRPARGQGHGAAGNSPAVRSRTAELDSARRGRRPAGER